MDDHPFARVTASPTFHEGRLYVGVASGEETAGAVAEYECCTFRGSLVVLDASTGARVWKTYTMDEPQKRATNRVGTQLWGPSGAPIWSSPAIDVKKNAVYVTTGNNYSGPANDRSDAFMNAQDVDVFGLQDPEVVRRGGRVIVIGTDHDHALRPPACRLTSILRSCGLRRRLPGDRGRRQTASGQPRRAIEEAATGEARVVRVSHGSALPARSIHD